MYNWVGKGDEEIKIANKVKSSLLVLYHKADFEAMNIHLFSIDWASQLSSDVDSRPWNHFKSLFLEDVYKFVSS